VAPSSQTKYEKAAVKDEIWRQYMDQQGVAPTPTIVSHLRQASPQRWHRGQLGDGEASGQLYQAPMGYPGASSAYERAASPERQQADRIADQIARYHSPDRTRSAPFGADSFASRNPSPRRGRAELSLEMQAAPASFALHVDEELEEAKEEARQKLFEEEAAQWHGRASPTRFRNALPERGIQGAVAREHQTIQAKTQAEAEDGVSSANAQLRARSPPLRERTQAALADHAAKVRASPDAWIEGPAMAPAAAKPEPEQSTAEVARAFTANEKYKQAHREAATGDLPLRGPSPTRVRLHQLPKRDAWDTERPRSRPVSPERSIQRGLANAMMAKLNIHLDEGAFLNQSLRSKEDYRAPMAGGSSYEPLSESDVQRAQTSTFVE